MARLIALSAFFIAFSLFSEAQGCLYLKKSGSTDFLKYRRYEHIRLQLKGDDRFVFGTITELGEDYFMIHETKMHVDSIYRIDIRNKSGLFAGMILSSAALITAGIVYPLAFVSTMLVSGEGAEVPPKSIWAGSLALVGAGISLRLLAPKYFKLGQKRKAVILLSDPVGSPGQNSPDRRQGDG